MGKAKKIQYLFDEKGQKTSVLIPILFFDQLVHELEELQDIKAYDNAKKNNEEVISLDQMLAEIEELKNK